MQCTNLNDVKVWWQVLSKKDVVIRRYTGVDICQLDRFVLKYLGKKTVDVDVVYPQDCLQELDPGEYKTIQDVEELLEPYEKMGVNYSMEMCYDADCVTCKNNNVIHNGAFRYSVTWDRPWFYVTDYRDWHEKNKHRKPGDIMDWYTI